MSGIEDIIKRIQADDLKVYTDAIASPTGFPFKVLPVEGTHSSQEVYEGRTRVCDLGYLRSIYAKENGKFGYRCPSEPVDTFLKKDGDIEETKGRKCLCNGLMANIGMPQLQKHGETELPLFTAGDNINGMKEILQDDATSYSAVDVLDYLRG